MINILKITGNPNESIHDVKKQLLFWILILINILGIPVVIIGLIEAFILNQTLAAISYLSFFSPIIFVTIYRKRLSFKISAFVLLLCLYGIGVFNLLIYGFSGAAIPIFFAFLVFTTIFFDTKSAFIGIIFCVLAMFSIGYLFVKNFINLEIHLSEISTQAIAWFTAISVLIFLGSLIILSVGIIQKKTLLSLQFSKQQASELKKLNLQLEEDVLKIKQLNSQLKEDVLKRKHAEEELKKHREQLEVLVKERTAKLEETIKDVEQMNELFVGREFRIKELRDEVEQLKLRITNNN